MGVAFVVDFVALHFKAWRDTFTTVLIPSFRTLTEDVKGIFVLNTSAAVLGLGYIVGIRYASIIMAGSFLSYWVFVPLIGYLGAHVPGEIVPGRPPIPGLSAEDLFFQYVRYIGIGAIFAAGVLSVLKMSPVIVQAVKQVFGELKHAGRGSASTKRTELDLPIGGVLAGAAGLAVLLFLYFRFSVLAATPSPTTLSLISVLLIFGITFLFAAVSAWAIAMISTTPISGMTLTTLIISALALSSPRPRRKQRHALGALDRRRGLHRALDDRLDGDAPQGGLLDGRDAPQDPVDADRGLRDRVGDRHRGHVHVRARVRVLPGPTHPNPGRSASGQRDGRRDLVGHAVGPGAVVPLRSRGRRRRDRADARHLGARLRARHVPSDRAEHADPGGRDRRVAREAQDGERDARPGARQPRARSSPPGSSRAARSRASSTASSGSCSTSTGSR
jgi:hypothetical protein